MQNPIASAKTFVKTNKTALKVGTAAVVVLIPMTWLAVQGLRATSLTMDFLAEKDLYDEWSAYLSDNS